MARVTDIFRHPIKGLGADSIPETALNTDRPLPLDRQWAILQEGQVDTGGWQKRRTFGHVARSPKLAQTRTESTDGALKVTHPDLPPLSCTPDTDGPRLLAWLRSIWGEELQPAKTLIAAPPTGMTDADYPSVSIMSHASLGALAQAAGRPLSPLRFRGNIWVDGLPPWAENE